MMNEPIANNTGLDTATFGGGCFWCTEAVFDRIEGVEKVVSGYSGGRKENPSYQDISYGNTGHAEVIQIVFNPTKISYDELLKIFWQTHDPTTLNRQGNDVGDQYRSVIFYKDDNQKQKAEYYKDELEKSGAYRAPIVTEIKPLQTFYPAENYHQNYYRQNPEQPYCRFVIQPKIEKLEAVFSDKLKK